LLLCGIDGILGHVLSLVEGLEESIQMRILTGLVLALCLMVSPALAQNVAVDFEQSFDFATAKTVAWGRGTPAQNEFNQTRIETAIAAALTEAGFEMVAVDVTPDLYVITHAAGQQQQKKSNVSVGIGVSRRTSFGSVGVGTSTSGKSKTVVLGTLVIQLISAADEKMVWRADLSDTLDGNAEKTKSKIDRAISKAFKKFPPAPKK
jgi:hypothetical protein